MWGVKRKNPHLLLSKLLQTDRINIDIYSIMKSVYIFSICINLRSALNCKVFTVKKDKV